MPLRPVPISLLLEMELIKDITTSASTSPDTAVVQAEGEGALLATRSKHRVADIHGDQIQVDGQWYHAERIFGKRASDFTIGQLVEQLAQASLPLACRNPASSSQPDELVGSALYRSCSSNEMTESKIDTFAQVMLVAGGWGPFPMISCYVETLDADAVAQCEALAAEGRAEVWLSEMGWSRLVTNADIGTRYAHIDNGHHRMAAAAAVSAQLGAVLVPVADRRVEESQSHFMSSDD